MVIGGRLDCRNVRKPNMGGCMFILFLTTQLQSGFDIDGHYKGINIDTIEAFIAALNGTVLRNAILRANASFSAV